MKKTFRILSALTLCAMIAVGFSACGNDNIPNVKTQDEPKVEDSTDGPQKIVLKFAMGTSIPGRHSIRAHSLRGLHTQKPKRSSPLRKKMVHGSSQKIAPRRCSSSPQSWAWPHSTPTVCG